MVALATIMADAYETGADLLIEDAEASLAKLNLSAENATAIFQEQSAAFAGR